MFDFIALVLRKVRAVAPLDTVHTVNVWGNIIHVLTTREALFTRLDDQFITVSELVGKDLDTNPVYVRELGKKEVLRVIQATLINNRRYYHWVYLDAYDKYGNLVQWRMPRNGKLYLTDIDLVN